ncbi:response regulator transcription factor [Candidatus Woesebacteria bacterium]|nr:response regulator transcription factor [Candidatus Woesebacteria bacterium]
MSEKSILICDDDEGIVDVASIILTDAGYKVFAITESQKVMLNAKKINPQLILLDLWMPNLSGEEVTKQLKQTPETSNIPIIIVSASRNTEDIAKRIGADYFLCKPFDMEELETVVKKYTD